MEENHEEEKPGTAAGFVSSLVFDQSAKLALAVRSEPLADGKALRRVESLARSLPDSVGSLAGEKTMRWILGFLAGVGTFGLMLGYTSIRGWIPIALALFVGYLVVSKVK